MLPLLDPSHGPKTANVFYIIQRRPSPSSQTLQRTSRLKQQSELQSQVKYKKDFEESKGRGFSMVTDTPELQRLRRTQDVISNVGKTL
ncbi:hypothetical protein WMY93_033643 [Mugilogobius chulae]|uniref:Uncharacterized protein n=1 Tax=Mugilogobius chulae TaxID=88201 RepID=A0AAW0MRD8_9GOBI